MTLRSDNILMGLNGCCKIGLFSFDFSVNVVVISLSGKDLS